MKKGILLLVVMCFLSAGMIGCTSKYLVNFTDQYYSMSGKTGPSLATIDKAIKEAGARRHWMMETAEPGHIIGLLRVRQHVASVDIRFDRQKFSITYRSSENLNYNASRNTIHGRYNTWVTYLRNDIQSNVPLYFNASANQPGSVGR
ncbi:MAG: hypothetical protein AB7D06_10165 [Pedobacter sp.]